MIKVNNCTMTRLNTDAHSTASRFETQDSSHSASAAAALANISRAADGDG
jgi:hypothetical protein